MRILFVLSRVPYPLEKGDKLRAFHFIRELSDNHEITLFCLADKRIDPEAKSKLRAFCSEVYIHRIPLYRKWLGLLIALFNKKPFQVEYFYSKSAQRKFDAFLEAHLPQHIFCQLIRTSEYAKKYSVIPKTLDYMDAFSAGMKRMAERASFPMSAVMNIEYLRLKNYEEQIAKEFQHRTIISEQDKACLNLKQSITVLPNGIGPQFFEDRSISQHRHILFTGNMSYRPNVESARFLAKEIMPLIWKEDPTIKLTLAGATPASTILALKSDRIEVTGWVDDIVAIYKSAKIFVAPMLINSGLQNKLLEAMACKVPCITTSLANNALGANSGWEILIGDTAQEIADHVLFLLTHTEEADNLGTQGHQYVIKNYSWKKEAERLEKLLLSTAR